jgi:hypothetical protein
VLLRHFRGTNLDSIEQKPYREMGNLFSAQGARGELCSVFAIRELCSQLIGTAMKRNVTSISMVTATGLPSEPTAGLNFHSFTVSTALFSNP